MMKKGFYPWRTRDQPQMVVNFLSLINQHLGWMGIHTVFGNVVEGMDVLDSIANVPVGAGNKPIEPVKMNTVEIIRNGKEARKFDAVQIMTDYFAGEEERLAKIEKEKAEKLAEENQIKTEFAAEVLAQKEEASQH